jgi:ATP-dependent RNA helicase DeaD
MTEITFEDLLLSPEIDSAIKNMGFKNPTEIQQKAIPIIKQGLDIIGKSQTGTGKTLSFAIPALELLDTKKLGVQVLVLCPTRELAVQAAQEVLRLSKFKKGVKIADVYGGAAMDRQILKLKTANFVVGTPGRIMDHLKRGSLQINNLKMAILDEADEMLSMGFIEDIKTILQYTPKQKQTILFSATMPPEILDLTKKFLKNPTLVEKNRKQVTVENISQSYYNVPASKRASALIGLFLYHDPKLSIIFCNTKKMVDLVTTYLRNNNLQAEGLHGDMKQNQRNAVMNSFKNGDVKILVATDVAARGIDVQNIDWVVNYDIPQNVEYYVHRIGRTGRAGKAGQAITICSGRSQAEVLKRIGRIVKSNITEQKLPKIDEILAKIHEKDANKFENKLKIESKTSPYQKMVEEFMQKGYDLLKIATAALEINFEKRDRKIKMLENFESAPEIRRTSSLRHFQSIAINVGKEQRVEARHLVGALTGTADVTGREIGKIEVLRSKSIVEVPKEKAEQIIKQMQGCKIYGHPVTVSVVNAKPSMRAARPRTNNFRASRR